jgi:arabinofuranan 3-O-arabinosyltransferase
LIAPPSTGGRPTRSPRDLSRELWTGVAGLGARIPPVALAYTAPSLVAAIAVQTWFHDGAGLASGDLVPPVAPGTDYRAHWNDFDTGAGAPSFQIVSLPYFEGLRLFSWLGFGEVAFQRLWLTVLVAGTAAAVVFLARGLVRSPLAAAVAGFVPLLSAYRLTLAFDPVPLVAMIAAAVLGGLVIRAGEERGPRPLVFGLTSLSCGFVLLNPPHLALVIVWIAVCTLLAWAVHGPQAPRRVGRFLVVGVPLALLFNLWWIVPAALTLTSTVFSDRFAAAGVEEWAWTHVRANVLHVLAFTSSWAWPHPEYFPFSARLARSPFAALQYIPAVAAVLGFGLAVRRRRRVALVLAVVGVLAIWVMKGLHGPLAGPNQWLYDTIPGFWLMRDPTKAGLILVLVFALLAALGLSQLIDRSRSAGVAAAVVVVAGAAAYAHPLFTGAVAPSERPLLPSAHVRIAPGWRAAAGYLATRPRDAKVVVLPRLDYYQAPTTWGYYGASFLHHLIERPVIEPLPAAYFHDPGVDSLVARLQAEILRGGEDVSGLLQALGARYVVLRRDLDTTFPDRSFASPGLLARRLAGIAELRHLRGFGEVDVYEAPTVRTAEVYAAAPVTGDEAVHADVGRALAVGQAAAVVGEESGEALDGIATAHARVVSLTRPTRRIAINLEQGVLVLRAAGERSARPLVSLPAPDPPFAVFAGSSRFPVGESSRASRRIGVLKPKDLADGPGFLPPQPLELRNAQARRVGDCNRYDDRSRRQVGIAARITGKGDERKLLLSARDHSACIAIPIPDARPGRRLRIQLSYRRVSGNPARVCVWQDGPDRCAALRALDPSLGWHKLDGTVTAAAGTESVRLFLYADGDRGGWRVNRTQYRRLTVAPPAPELSVTVQPPTRLPDISYRRTAPGEYRVHVEGADRPFVLVGAETFAPGWKVKAAGRNAGDITHFRVNGYANGWRIPWTGSYELTISYGPEGFARAARRLDLVAVLLGVLALVLGPRWARRRRSSRARANGDERSADLRQAPRDVVEDVP